MLAAARYLLAAALLGMPGAAVGAEAVVHRTVFDVAFGLLPVGRATFEIRLDEGGYLLDGSGRTVGIAEFFAPGRGSVESQGRIDGHRVIAVRNAVEYVEKKKRKATLEMQFEGGRVVSVRLNPDKRKKKNGPKWVPIAEDQLRSVIDPASGIVVPIEPERARDPRAVCDRVLNVYDGDTRFDIALSYKATRDVETEGYSGPAYVCRMRYIPVAGHKREQRNVEYMRRNDGIEIWLAPIAGTATFTPIHIEVPTWIGRIWATARYFGPARQ